MRRKWRDRARFKSNTPAPSRLPGAISVVPRSLAGEEVVEDAQFKTVTITPKDASSHGLTLKSQGASATGNELRAIDSSDNTLLEIDNSAHVNFGSYWAMTEISAPGTPNANIVRVFVADKGGVSTLYYRDDAGVAHDLSAQYDFLASMAFGGLG